MVYRDTFFVDPVASSTAPYPQELNPWSSGRSEPIHSSTSEKNENQTPVQDQRCQSDGWRRLIQMMIKNLRHLQEEFECQILKYSIASAQNRIIHNSHFKRRVSLGEQKA